MGIRKFNVMDLGKASLIKPEQLGYKDSLEIIKDESYKIHSWRIPAFHQLFQGRRIREHNDKHARNQPHKTVRLLSDSDFLRDSFERSEKRSLQEMDSDDFIFAALPLLGRSRRNPHHLA